MGCSGCVGKIRRVTKDVDNRFLTEDDGSLLFNKLAPTREGFVHDRADPRRLKPDTIPCTGRITLPVLSGKGQWVINQCNQIGCPTRGQTVDEIVCEACPFRTVKIKPKQLER